MSTKICNNYGYDNLICIEQKMAETLNLFDRGQVFYL